jgi:hypothetical protein
MALDLPHRRRSPGPGVAPGLRTFLTSGDPLEQAERNWLAEAAADPSGDAP